MARVGLQPVCIRYLSDSIELKFIVSATNGFCRFRQGTDYTALNPRQLWKYRLTGKEDKYTFRMKAIAAGDKPEALAKQKIVILNWKKL